MVLMCLNLSRPDAVTTSNSKSKRKETQTQKCKVSIWPWFTEVCIANIYSDDWVAVSDISKEKKTRMQILPLTFSSSYSCVDAGRKVASGVPELPQKALEFQIRVNFQPFPVEALVKFQRFPGFMLLAKHAPAVHKVATLTETLWRQRGIRHPMT